MPSMPMQPLRLIVPLLRPPNVSHMSSTLPYQMSSIAHAAPAEAYLLGTATSVKYRLSDSVTLSKVLSTVPRKMPLSKGVAIWSGAGFHQVPTFSEALSFVEHPPPPFQPCAATGLSKGVMLNHTCYSRANNDTFVLVYCRVFAQFKFTPFCQKMNTFTVNCPKMGTLPAFK